LEFGIKLGFADIVLFVGFNEDGEAEMPGGDMVIDGLPDVVFPSNAVGKAELSDGDSSRSSVGRDGLGGASARAACVPGEDDLRIVECPSELVSACGIGMVGKIGCGRARLGATRCEEFRTTQVPLNKRHKPCRQPG
jgi:hypothetical protein